MKAIRPILAAVMLGGLLAARAAGFYGVTDPTMGEYEGFWTAADGAKGRITAQVRPLGNNRYDGFVLFFRGRSPVTAVNLQPALLENSHLNFTARQASPEEGGDLFASIEATATMKDGKLAGKFQGDFGEGGFEAEKNQRTPTTLGAKPPAGAIVLFDGQPGAAWENFSWPVQDGIATVGKGNIRFREKLDNFRLHLEFRTPYMPAATGQARGNSGVYLQGKYEVQVLDSFGLYPLQSDDCGGIYKAKSPRLNACLPPMEWQAYDITFLNESGSPKVTVIQNGVTVLDSVKLAPRPDRPGTSPVLLLLQDHGNPVQYRNIWAEPLKQ
jgi:hypothetical protein